MFRRLLQLLKIRQSEKRYKSNYQARQKSFNQIKQASKYVI